MGNGTGIEWTDATWNPVVGCSIVSPGCTNCYAMTMAARIQRMTPGSHYAGTTQDSKAGPVWTGKLALAPQHILTAPLRWKKSRRIFVNSMGDLFHEDCPDEWIDQVFAVMALAPQHTFQVLTKRAERMRGYVTELCQESRAPNRFFRDFLRPTVGKNGDSPAVANARLGDAVLAAHDYAYPLQNVWLGVSAEDQKRADERLPHLVNTPAAIRFVSAEPLLGPIKLTDEHLFGFNDMAGPLHWVIVGGESGPGARPMHPDWARSLRDQCAAAAVPFFFKQWGEFHPADQTSNPEQSRAKGDLGRALRDGHAVDLGTMWTWRVGKRAAGRLLDGAEHNGMPS